MYERRKREKMQETRMRKARDGNKEQRHKRQERNKNKINNKKETKFTGEKIQKSVTDEEKKKR